MSLILLRIKFSSGENNKFFTIGDSKNKFFLHNFIVLYSIVFTVCYLLETVLFIKLMLIKVFGSTHDE